MTDDLVKQLREYGSCGMVFEAADRIEGLQGQIRVIQSAAKYATKAYEQQIAVLRKALDEKPPIWHDDIQSLQERDAIMTDRIEKLEEQAHYANGVADLAMKHRNYAEQRVEKLEAALAHIYAWYPISVSEPLQTIKEISIYARKALEGKDD